MTTIQLIATTPMGLEAVAARELKELGYEEQVVENGRITFPGNLYDICRTNLWLRTAGRILVKIGQFEARSFDDLFEGTKALPWAYWIPQQAEFPVDGRSHKSQLSSVPACQGIVKKAIVESMKQRYRTDWFPESGPRYVVEVSLLNDIATLTLDTTGAGLHKRGYRKLAAEAPLRESLAAAMILLSRWRPDHPLYDPFCGSGTIPIEAAMIGLNMAPGLRRTFNAEAWQYSLPARLWHDAREEARGMIRTGVELNIVGSDLDQEAINLALQACSNAGLGSGLKFEVKPVDRIDPQGGYGSLITNPPYGERLGSLEEAERAVKQLGRAAKKLLDWSHFVLSPNRTFESSFGRRADKKRKLFNGQIECTLYQFLGPLPPRR